MSRQPPPPGNRRRRSPSEQEQVQAVRIIPGPTDKAPVLFANNMVVNFTGTEFIVTILVAAPPVSLHVGQSPLPSSIQADVLGRFVFSIPAWYGTVKSIDEQMERLTSNGRINIEEVTEGDEDGDQTPS